MTHRPRRPDPEELVDDQLLRARRHTESFRRRRNSDDDARNVIARLL